MLEKISEARHVTVDELNAMADGLKLRTAEDALRLKMVDSFCTAINCWFCSTAFQVKTCR